MFYLYKIKCNICYLLIGYSAQSQSSSTVKTSPRTKKSSVVQGEIGLSQVQPDREKKKRFVVKTAFFKIA